MGNVEVVLHIIMGIVVIGSVKNASLGVEPVLIVANVRSVIIQIRIISIYRLQLQGANQAVLQVFFKLFFFP